MYRVPLAPMRRIVLHLLMHRVWSVSAILIQSCGWISAYFGVRLGIIRPVMADAVSVRSRHVYLGHIQFRAPPTKTPAVSHVLLWRVIRLGLRVVISFVIVISTESGMAVWLARILHVVLEWFACHALLQRMRFVFPVRKRRVE